MEFISAKAESRYADLVRAAAETVVGLDLDGTLSPIVDDPAQALIHPDAHKVLTDLADQVRAIAIITGRPAQQAIALGDLDHVGDTMAKHGKVLHVFGQYGNERWSSSKRRVISPRPPRGLHNFIRELPAVLRNADAADAYIEEKGLAVAIHTRRLTDSGAAYQRLRAPLTRLATANGLTLEPGRSVIEIRAPGTHKGDAVQALAREHEARGFLFAGDDLGDVEAFAAVAELRGEGLPTLLVCSSSEEQGALMNLADVVVAGPDGVLDLLRQLTLDAANLRR